jgi:hypothetical protein
MSDEKQVADAVSSAAEAVAETVKEAAAKVATPIVEIKTEAGPLATMPQLPESSSEYQQVVDQVMSYISTDAIGKLYQQYKQPITTLGVIVGAIVTLKVTLAVISALNEVPLLSPTFELIGMGYSTWFLWRYLLRADTRENLSEEFNGLKEKVLGSKK